MTATVQKPPPAVPRWLVRTIWVVHRVAYSINRWGMLRLKTIGRRTGRERVAIVGFIEDGPNLVIPAMNGWADPEPAWWLNLQSNPEATVELPNGIRQVRARAAVGEERERLWASFLSLGSAAFTDASAASRSRETAIVVLEPSLD